MSVPRRRQWATVAMITTRSRPSRSTVRSATIKTRSLRRRGRCWPRGRGDWRVEGLVGVGHQPNIARACERTRTRPSGGFSPQFGTHLQIFGLEKQAASLANPHMSARRHEGARLGAIVAHLSPQPAQGALGASRHIPTRLSRPLPSFTANRRERAASPRKARTSARLSARLCRCSSSSLTSLSGLRGRSAAVHVKGLLLGTGEALQMGGLI